ncbi:hypothetical protein MAPG_06438 [Magnaporthiopsis poae ATCC 64411]|uniref:Uncharacterized protein n=1 Tax=Magnaporthiopsis poae (strain ATCC 64411 / 73-15) TaxID=644358 RepID=A0A0C4E212_MAGP6|nr:hypothetical protein MAPG_06438 [Magnaporthiopsis poae ATCC 64411]
MRCEVAAAALPTAAIVYAKRTGGEEIPVWLPASRKTLGTHSGRSHTEFPAKASHDFVEKDFG